MIYIAVGMVALIAIAGVLYFAVFAPTIEDEDEWS